MGTYTWVKAPVPDELEIRQVYGIVFSNDGRVLLRIEDEKYKLTGGKPENNESFEETLKREYIEELNVELEDIHYLGYLLIEEDGIRYAQVRMIARIKDIHEIQDDPANGKRYGRKLVSMSNIKNYLNYTDEAGNQMLEDAIDLAIEKCNFGNALAEERCNIANNTSKDKKNLENIFTENNDLILLVPSEEMEKEALEYKDEHFSAGDIQIHGSGGLAFYDDYGEWLSHIESIRQKSQERPIQTSTFFSKRVSDGKMIGCIKIHHSLTDDLQSGGHIAYGIRPSERGKDYGRKQLQLGLAYARQQHLDQVIIACDKDNAASAATAKSCNGVLVKEFEEDGVIKQHYAIKL